MNLILCSFVLMGDDAARLRTARSAAAPCRAITHQNKRTQIIFECPPTWFLAEAFKVLEITWLYKSDLVVDIDELLKLPFLQPKLLFSEVILHCLVGWTWFCLHLLSWLLRYFSFHCSRTLLAHLLLKAKVPLQRALWGLHDSGKRSREDCEGGAGIGRRSSSGLRGR